MTRKRKQYSNQLWPYGGINYLAKGSEYEVDFILTREERSAGLGVKYHPIQSDDQKLKRIAAKRGLGESWLVGKYPTQSFSRFIWVGWFFDFSQDKQSGVERSSPVRKPIINGSRFSITDYSRR